MGVEEQSSIWQVMQDYEKVFFRQIKKGYLYVVGSDLGIGKN